jgi:hypothetical protein
MKFLGAIALTGVFLLPNIVSAACVADGATVAYINGIFTTEKQAKSDLNNLKSEYIRITGDPKIIFINAYNPSHLAGAGDLMQAAAQLRGKSISGFDLRTILLQMHPQVTTRKLLLVGHSQGSFYANDVYDYLLSHGEPKASVGVYQVGSPASHVAGGGKYLNSSGDAMLGTLRGLGFTFLPDNIDLASYGDDARKMFFGHSFSGAYLAEAPDRVVGDVQKSLGKLKAESPSDAGDCFTAPNAGVGYTGAKAGFAVADTAALGIKSGAIATGRVAAAAGSALAAAAQAAYGAASKVAADIGVTVGGVVGLSRAAEPQKAQTNFDVFSRLYGSSLTKDDYRELMGGAVAMAPVLAAAPAPAQSHQGAASAAAQPASVSVYDTDENEDGAAFLLPLLAGSGGARHHRASSGEPEAPPAADAPYAEPAADAASSTQEAIVAPPAQEATTTPAEAATTTLEGPTLAFVSGGSPVTDSFDGYTGSGWETYGGYPPFGFSPGVIKYFATTTGCHSGGCLSGTIQTSNGGYGNPVRMYKTGTPVAEGSISIWRKYHTGYVYRGNMGIMVCVGAPDQGNKCDGIGDIFIGDAEDTWNQYYFAWRNNGTVKEFCTSRYEFNPLDCAWRPSSTIAADDVPDTVLISGDGGRPDLGDRIWFDDLGTP